MKKLLFTSFLFVITISITSAQSKWNIGISSGCVTNISKFDSGQEEANALFSNYPSKSFGLGINMRYKISEKFAFTTGMFISQMGFSYAMAKDYSLLKPFEQHDYLTSQTCMISVPSLLLFNTKTNCNNIRWVFGLGASVRAVDNDWKQNEFEEITPEEGGNIRSTIMTSESHTENCISPSVTWQIGIEKMMKNGNSFSFVYTGNQGLNTISESTVNYTASNKNYTHTFINRGSYVNLAFAYNFMPFGTKKAMKAIK